MRPLSGVGIAHRLSERWVLVYGHEFGLELVRNYKRSIVEISPALRIEA